MGQLTATRLVPGGMYSLHNPLESWRRLRSEWEQYAMGFLDPVQAACQRLLWDSKNTNYWGA